ncbi:hypothetical protein FNF28_03178 [Cafeteria roenbergensis]|uniref:Uncharacterized protein n=1 Tax=Cafeteria roenbergensis TaxID=33653 RepID=A0A5A8DMM9_CAFRO|nr:hypothetical protein FNF28_03178 [Cafeteria roenbergensis]
MDPSRTAGQLCTSLKQAPFERALSPPGPGPVYHPHGDAVGKQPLSTKITAPSYVFGTSQREEHIKNDTPGPGSTADGQMYGKIRHSSKFRSSATPSFGTSPRDVPTRPDGPGPGEYRSPSGFGRQSASTRITAPAFGLRSTPRGACESKDESPGPGAYSVAERPKSAGARFGTAQRSPDRPSDTPGPGQYGSGSGFGRQPGSRQLSSPAYGLGSAPRDSPRRGDDAPGPGAYGAPDTHPSAGGAKFGTAERGDGRPSDTPGPGECISCWAGGGGLCRALGSPVRGRGGVGS